MLQKRTKHRKFNEEYVNSIRGWDFSEAEVERAKANKEMLMLDFEIGEYCSLKCGYCFRKSDVRDRGLKALDPDETKNIIDQAAGLGVRSVHIVGQGEPLEDERFLEIIEYIHEKEVHGKSMIPLIFTAGHVFGDDAKAQKYHGMDGSQLVEKLYALDASIIVKIHSLRPELSDKIVGVQGKYEYTKHRDMGIGRLIDAGFTKLRGEQLNPTRLGADILVLRQNYDEILDIYVRCRDENIYPIVVTFIPCGLTSYPLQRKKYDIGSEEKTELWKRIYKYNYDQGIRFEGVSALAGGHKCTQLKYALYVNVRGQVWSCPGEPDPFHLGSLVGSDKQSLKEIWDSAPRNMNQICTPRFKCGSLPRDLREKTEEYLESLKRS